MSASSHVTLWCDAEWCSNWTDHGQPMRRETRALARAEGWVSRDGKDYCCTAHANGKRTAHEVLIAAHDARQARLLAEQGYGARKVTP